MNPNHRYQKLWLTIGYALVTLVIYLSVSSNPPDSGIEWSHFDKVLHALSYFMVMVWFAQIYHVKKPRIICAILLVVLGMLLEYVQSFDPARTAEFADIVANTAGVMLALIVTTKPAFRSLLQKIETYI